MHITRGLKKKDLISLLLYVNDILPIGLNKDQVQELKAQLVRKFDMKDLGLEIRLYGCKFTKTEIIGRFGFLKRIS